MSAELTDGAVLELEVSMLWSDFFPVLQVAHCLQVSRFCLEFNATHVYFQSLDQGHVSLLEACIPLCAFSRLAHYPSPGYVVDFSINALYKAAQRPTRSNASSSHALVTLQVVRSPASDTWNAILYHGDTERYESCHEIPIFNATDKDQISVPEDQWPSLTVSSLLWKNAVHAYQGRDDVIEIESDAKHFISFRKTDAAVRQRIPSLSHSHEMVAIAKVKCKSIFLKPLAAVLAKITDRITVSRGVARPLHYSFSTWTSDRIRKQADDVLQVVFFNDLCKIILSYLAPPNLAITFHHYIAPYDPAEK